MYMDVNAQSFEADVISMNAISAVFSNSSSMSFGDRVAVFKQRAASIGLADDVCAKFKGEDLDTMAKFAFACNYAPGASDDSAFKELMTKILGREPSLVEGACMRRLYN